MGYGWLLIASNKLQPPARRKEGKKRRVLGVVVSAFIVLPSLNYIMSQAMMSGMPFALLYAASPFSVPRGPNYFFVSSGWLTALSLLSSSSWIMSYYYYYYSIIHVNLRHLGYIQSSSFTHSPLLLCLLACLIGKVKFLVVAFALFFLARIKATSNYVEELTPWW